MKKSLSLLLTLTAILLFNACSGKQLKKYGGNIAVSGGGNPIMAATGALVGGTLYGVGYLLDDEKDKKEVKDNKKENLEKKEEEK
jgi:hypothetical protein|tara:strand:+ start:1932 stop:2186 length:255 start_codon:yes stop_codon:yes gene_type:complete